MDSRLHLPALLEYRAAVRIRRAGAFCDAPEYVLGIEVLPLSPATFSMLLATESHFVVGGLPTEADVRNYVWFHSRLYAHCGVRTWPLRKRAALWRLDAMLKQAWRRPLRWCGHGPSIHRYHAALVLAITQIRHLVDQAFADAPSASGRPGKPVATMEAQLIHRFAEAYGWSPDRTRTAPLRRLFQLDRCIAASRGVDVADEGEDRILADHLNERQAQLNRERAVSSKR